MTFSDAKQQSPNELTPEEMLEISHEINRKFAPNAASIISDTVDFSFNESDLYTFLRSTRFDRIAVLHSQHDSRIGLSRSELHEISLDISRRFLPHLGTASPELLLLPVDPDHLYACWDLGEHRASFLTSKHSSSGLTLRIYWRPNENSRAAGSNVWFDVEVNEANARQKVRLPIDDSAYSAALGKVNADYSFDAYVHSNIIRVPPNKKRMGLLQRGEEKDFGSDKTTIDQPVQSPPPACEKNSVPNESPLQDILEKLSTLWQINENGWFVKLHVQQFEPDESGNESIVSRLRDLLNKKGVDIQLIPEPSLCEQPSIHGKTASGQGL